MKISHNLVNLCDLNKVNERWFNHLDLLDLSYKSLMHPILLKSFDETKDIRFK